MRRTLLVVSLTGLACSQPAAKQSPPRPVTPDVVAADAADGAVAEPAPASSESAPTGKAWIGVRLDPGSLRITHLLAGAPGEKSGLRIGDQLVTLDGQAVTTVPAFVDRVQRTRVGQRLAIVVARAGQQMKFDIAVEARPESPAKATLLDKPAPLFDAPLLAGPFAPRLADLKGNIVVVDFWATWCGPCTYTIPKLVELQAKYGARGVKIVGLSSEEPDVIRKFAADTGMTYAIGHDRDDAIAKDYLREGIPMFVIVDRAGVVRNIVVGAHVETVEATITALLAMP